MSLDLYQSREVKMTVSVVQQSPRLTFMLRSFLCTLRNAGRQYPTVFRCKR